MDGILFVRSALSLATIADDRIALNDPKDLPKKAAEKGWSHCVLVDERTMAGSLDFLESGRKAKIATAVGINASALRDGAGAITAALFALDQVGLSRLIGVSDKIAKASRLEEIHDLLAESASDGVNLALALFPAKSNIAPGKLHDWRALGVGAFVAIADSNGAELRAYPSTEAIAYASASKLPLVKVRMGYMAEGIQPEFRDAFATVAEKASEGRSAKSSRPDLPPDPTIPLASDAAEGDVTASNAARIVSRIAETTLVRKPTLPKSAAHGTTNQTADERLTSLAEDGLEARIAKGKIKDTPEVRQRLAYELGLITQLGFSDYFLIMREAIGYAKAHDIPVGPGRGSAAGSLVAFSIGLTDIEPIRFGLLFERFINPERISLPDIDTDFCIDRRAEVIDHMARTFGDENVAQIATYAHRQPKAAIRDAARALGLNGAGNGAVKAVEKLGKGIEEGWKQVLEDHPEPDIRRVGEFAKKLHNIASHKGVHAGGLIVSDTPIRQNAPVDCERSDIGRLVIEFDMKSTEASGFVKLDFLGLKTLTVIKRTLDDLRARGVTPDLTNIGEDDPEVYEMLRKGRTRTVFQLESAGMTQAGMEIEVSQFDDIVALVALYRPGPMEYIPLYAQRKKGQAPVTYLDPCMEEITGSTYGIIIYQEQIMHMARSWAAYTMPEADNLRRAIGKKIKEAVEAERVTFMAKCEALGRDPEISEKLFDYVLPFALYGFNKSHAVAYATITWQTAWLKHHHTAAWLCAAATLENEPEKVEKIIREAIRYKIKILPPDINASKAGYTWHVEDGKTYIRLPLESIARVGAEAARGAVAERERNGAFISLRDFCERVSSLNKSQIESLIGAGAFDCITPKPPTVGRPMLKALLAETQIASRQAKAANKSQMGLFADADMPMSFDGEPRAKYFAITPEEAARQQHELLQGLLSHERKEIVSIAWRREIARSPTLKQALDMAKNSPCRIVAITRGASERIVTSAEGSRRVLVLNIEDETLKKQIDIHPDVDLPDDVMRQKAIPVEVVLRPSSGHALISHVPEIASIKPCPDPVAEPRANPVLTVERELDAEDREFIRSACREAISQPKDPAARKARIKARNTAMSHLVIVPPSLVVEILPLPPNYDPAALVRSLDSTMPDKYEFLPESAQEVLAAAE